MKGIVFTLFNDLVEEKFGLETWDKMLEETKPESNGVYNAGGTYPHQEMLSLVGSLSKFSGVPAGALVTAFGEYMFPFLAKRYPVFFSDDKDLKRFLLSIEKVVHVEVHKLYPNAELPRFEYEEGPNGELVMIYRSFRKMCPLAVGLINGASKHFNQPVAINHPICMNHDHSDHCRLEISFIDQSK